MIAESANAVRAEPAHSVHAEIAFAVRAELAFPSALSPFFLLMLSLSKYERKCTRELSSPLPFVLSPLLLFMLGSPLPFVLSLSKYERERARAALVS